MWAIWPQNDPRNTKEAQIIVCIALGLRICKTIESLTFLIEHKVEFQYFLLV